MAREGSRRGGHLPSILTTDELLVHLREAGAKRVYLSRTDAFRDGSLPLVATYEFTTAESTHESRTASEREMLESVFDAIDDRLRFHDREWILTWSVEPAFTEPQLDLVPLYDRSIEYKHGDGFNLANLFFVYEEYREMHGEP